MQLAHSGDDGLSCLFVRMGPEGRIFFRELHEGFRHLLLAGLGLRLDGKLDNGLGEFH